MSRIMIDSFTGALGELPKGGRSIKNALRALQTNPRVSTFERGPAWLESLIAELVSSGYVVEYKAEPYPWHRFTITEAGRDGGCGGQNGAKVGVSTYLTLRATVLQ